MGGGRFGPVQPDRAPKKKYKIDYNRLVTIIMVVAILVLAWFIYADWRGKKENPEHLITSASVPPSAYTSAQGFSAVPTPAPLRPISETEGQLPIFRVANTQEKIVAITVDSLRNTANIDSLFSLCKEYGARVTLFPTGQELHASPNVWAEAVLAGHEIENHSYQNADLTQMTAEEIKDELGRQTTVVRQLTNNEYAPHFFRPDNLLNLDIAPLHEYLIAEGYYGIASWAADTPQSIDDVVPGQVIRYKLDDAGLKKLKQAIPVLVQNGYLLVTLNELFAYADNFSN